MSRAHGTQAEDQGRTEAPVGVQAVVLDKAAVPEKAVGIDGKIKKAGFEGPGFFYNLVNEGRGVFFNSIAP